MFTIRRDQFDAFDPHSEQVFVSQLSRFVRDNLPEHVIDLDDQALAWRVGGGLARARSHGFTLRSTIATFVTLMFRFAPNFDDYPPITAIVDAVGVDEQTRAEQLMSLAGETWQAVEARFDPLAWYDFGPASTR